MAADMALGIGMEAGEVLHAPVHGEGRARHRRLEITPNQNRTLSLGEKTRR